MHNMPARAYHAIVPEVVARGVEYTTTLATVLEVLLVEIPRGIAGGLKAKRRKKRGKYLPG